MNEESKQESESVKRTAYRSFRLHDDQVDSECDYLLGNNFSGDIKVRLMPSAGRRMSTAH